MRILVTLAKTSMFLCVAALSGVGASTLLGVGAATADESAQTVRALSIAGKDGVAMGSLAVEEGRAVLHLKDADGNQLDMSPAGIRMVNAGGIEVAGLKVSRLKNGQTILDFSLGEAKASSQYRLQVSPVAADEFLVGSKSVLVVEKTNDESSQVVRDIREGSNAVISVVGKSKVIWESPK